MAYFSNGTEGEHYAAKYCDSCVHQLRPCPIWDAHLLFAYDSDKNELAKSILDFLIPIRKDGFAGKCKMFESRERGVRQRRQQRRQTQLFVPAAGEG